jgi:hypothetical protein
MKRDCTNPVTHIGEKGFVYCAEHAPCRKGWERCRKMRVWELKLLAEGKPLPSYQPIRRSVSPPPDAPHLVLPPPLPSAHLAPEKEKPMKMFVSVDGFIKLAEARGLQQIRHAIGPGASGLECVCVLRDNKGTDTQYRYTMADVYTAGVGHSRIWELYPHKMFQSFATRNAIMTHYKLNEDGTEKS